VTTHDVEKTHRKPTWQDYLHVFGKAHRKASVQLETSMPLLLHLEELRQRIFKAFGALILTTSISFAFAGQLINYFAEPIGGSKALVSIEVTENIAIFMRVALLGGVILAMPVIAYQALSFILPGLKKKERTWLLVGVVAASMLFLGGVSFAWFVMIPAAVPFLVNFLGITTHVRPMNYFDFITTLMFWIGICFEMPLVVMMLAKLKFVTARQLAQGWRYAVVGIAVVAALVTPTVDPVNMSLVMLPLLGLYLISILLAAIAGGRSH
jgi:sec-independent protein translocase protein TatC